jgi:hypothetical protein
LFELLVEGLDEDDDVVRDRTAKALTALENDDLPIPAG